MAERVVYLNGDYVPERDAKVSVLDRGFRWGDAVYDATRTFDGRLFKLHEHVERFFRSLRYARIDPRLDRAAVTACCEEVVRRNEPARRAADGDYILTMQASRGLVGGIYSPGESATPTVTAYCMPLAFATHARYYRNGAPVIVTATRRTPPESVSPRAKVSNKMNHFQAEFEAKAADPDAFALMLDTDGNIAESSGSDFLFVSNGSGSRSVGRTSRASVCSPPSSSPRSSVCRRTRAPSRSSTSTRPKRRCSPRRPIACSPSSRSTGWRSATASQGQSSGGCCRRGVTSSASTSSIRLSSAPDAVSSVKPRASRPCS
jgi:branched-subunit amino acid aminotransferase/4-amino-4-deoxychorismate lyase